MLNKENAWEQIRARAGETFVQKRGGTFRYTVEGNYLCPDRTPYKIPRKDFEAALALFPFRSTTVLQDLRGPSYIYAILMDPRIHGNGVGMAPPPLSPGGPLTRPATKPAPAAPLQSETPSEGHHRAWLGFNFVPVGPVSPDRDPSGAVLEMMPQAAYAGAATAKLNRWGKGPFCKFRIPGTWADSRGVYVITVDGVLRYAGQCENLATRFNMGYGTISPRNCYDGGQATNCKVNNFVLRAVQEGSRVELWFHRTDDLDGVEGSLLTGLKPPWNGRL